MLTIAEYHQAAKQADRRFGWQLTVWTIAWLLYLVTPMVVYASVFGKVRDDHVDWAIQLFGPNGTIALLIVWFVPAGLLMFLSMWRMDERMAARDPRLRCANCNRALGSTPWVIAIRRCRHCQAQVLEDPVENGPLTVELPTRERFDSIAQELASSFFPWRYIVICFVGLVLAYISLAMDLPLALGVVALLLSIVSIVIGMLSALPIFKKYQWLQCPGCRRALLEFPRIIEQTGNCPNCGRRVLADS